LGDDGIYVDVHEDCYDGHDCKCGDEDVVYVSWWVTVWA